MVAPPGSTSTRPLLAYVFHPRSLPTLSVADAAREVCDLLWVLDGSVPESALMARLLSKLGAIVDVQGMDPVEAASAIRSRGADGILAMADELLCWTAEVAIHAGLAFHSTSTALALTDKLTQRQALRDAGLRAPMSWAVPATHGGTWPVLAASVPFPAIVKPRHGEASRDTVRVDSLAELEARLAAGASSRVDDDVVIEEYIPDGPDGIAGEGFAGYVSVESVASGGTVTHLAVTGRMPPAEPFRETGFFIPSELPAPLVAEVTELATRAVQAVGVRTGCLHTEVKLTGHGPVVIEVNGRIGGGVPGILHAATGVEMVPLAMRLALGAPVDVEAMPACARVAYLFYVQAPAAMRTVTRVDGLDAVAAIEGVDGITLNRGPGSSVDWREGNHGHVCSIEGTTTDHDALRRVAARIEGLVRIEGV